MWFKVDDQLAFHRKTLKAGNAAMGLWVRSGAWLSAQKRTDAPGVITYAELLTMGTSAQITRLLAAGFFEATRYEREKALRFHDWDHYQPDPEDVTAKRDDWKVRKTRQRHHKAGDHNLCLPAYCDQAPPHREEHYG